LAQEQLRDSFGIYEAPGKRSRFSLRKLCSSKSDFGNKFFPIVISFGHENQGLAGY
jgi:hypothetical protein